MPAQTQKSPLMAALAGAGVNEAMANAASGEIDWGFQRIPAGILNGVAQLSEVKFDVYKSGTNKGKPYFRAVGVVIEPRSIIKDGAEVVVAGMQTSIMEPCCNTTTQDGKKSTSAGEHAANVIMEMRKLGADFGPKPQVHQLEPAAKALTESARNGNPVYFRFSTSERKPRTPKDEPGVWENWYGVKGLEDYVPPEAAEAGVHDATGEQQTQEPQALQDQAAVPDVQAGGDEEVDLDALAAAADGDPEHALDEPDGPGLKIGQVAEQVGADLTAVSSANSWAEAVEIIRAAAESGQGGEDAAPAAPPWVAKKGETCGFKPTVKGVRAKASVACKITALYPKVGQCDLQQLANPKVTYLKVKVADLEPPA